MGYGNDGGSDAAKVGWAAGGVGWLLLVLLGIACLGLWGCPQYRVYEQRMAGEARLREAESSRQIVVEEARAKEHSAKMLAAAEIERAKGVAGANEIIGASLKDNPEYLMWLWIEKVSDNDNSIVYIPTESGMPILEASRLMLRRKHEALPDGRK
jgi:hypothetical protein